MPPKASKGKNAHDKRHESGLAPPGKRVSKQRSNGQLNGHPNGRSISPVPPAPLPSSGLNQGFRFPRTADFASPSSEPAPQPPNDFSRDHAVAPETTGRDRASSLASLEESGLCGDMADTQREFACVASNLEARTTVPKSPVPQHAGSPFSSISTIIAYYPLRDAISILILLLSLPPTLVLMIQTLFASLTFVPPTAGISLSLSNIKDVFTASNLGYPALITILIVDLIFWVCWLPVWKPLQNVFLDLSQAVIAVSLSGAAASTGGPTYSIATTSVIVCLVHVLRHKAIHLTALDYLRSVIHKMDIGVQLDLPFFFANIISPPVVDRGWFYTVTRTILGIHIVSQGVTTCIRRSLVKANEQSAHVPVTNKVDSEPTPSPEPNSRSNTAPTEALPHPTASSSTDGRPPGPSPAHRENKPRESSSKKKRKQANQVRSQQPLWAAIASTKVTFVKEMEQRDAVDDAREATNMDTNLDLTPSNITNQANNRIWICDVRDTEIIFSVQLGPTAAAENVDGVEDAKQIGAGIDKSKPFYVCINGATWSSTRIMSSVSEDSSNSRKCDHYDGEIFGLAPFSTYDCEIVGIASNKVLCAAKIITQPAPTAEQAMSATTQSQPQALRPSSPITTLKQSIQSAEAKLHETRNRSKKSKKDQRAGNTDIKREIQALRTKLESSGGTDDKQERRLMQINQHKHQAEEAAAEIKDKIDALGGVPEVDVAQSDARRRTWQHAMDDKAAADQDFATAKLDADREVSAIRADISQAETKQEKLGVRNTQRAQELEKLVSKHYEDMTAKQKRDIERAHVMQHRENEESQLRFLTAKYESEAQGYQHKAQDAYQQIASLQSWPIQQPSFPGSPPTPESTMSAVVNGSLVGQQTNNFAAFGPLPFQSPFHSAQVSLSQMQNGGRGRSSSMLSQYSGFTDNGEEHSFAPEPVQQYAWAAQPSAGVVAAAATAAAAAVAGFMEERKTSDGSGSLSTGSNASNSPRPDLRLFSPGPIGPPKAKDAVKPRGLS